VGTEQEPVTPQIDQELETPQAPQVEEPTVTTEGTEETPATPQPPAPDYKQKFVESGRESILNAERVKVANDRIEQLTNTDTPTDEAMRVLYPEWDNLDDYNKKVLIKQEATAMQQQAILAKQQEIDARQKLEDQLDDVIDNSKFASKLQGKEAEFKRFARNPKNRGIAADTLASAFLFDAEEEPQAPNPTPMTEALPAGSGGPREPLTQKKIPIEEARAIRQTNYKEWKRLLDAGMIEEDV
jgi:transposase